MIDCGNGVRLERNLRCKMRDGVELVSDHYYPAGNGRCPTLLVRQPYGKDIATTVVYAHPIWFARHGYNVVVQDVRGRGESEGTFYPFRKEGEDGFDTIAWLAVRPECDGQVGMYGFSYQGMTQLLAAAEQPPALKVIVPAMTAGDLFHGWFYMNGALRQSSTLSWGLQMMREDARRLGLRESSEKLEHAWSDLKPEIHEAPMLGERIFQAEGLPTYLTEWIERNQSGEYWEALDISRKLEKICVPALHVSGWCDTYLEGSVAGFDALRSQPHQYLLAGPWIHLPWGEKIGDMDFGKAAGIDTDEIVLKWLDHWLKGSGSFVNEPAIRHFVMGKNEWQTAENWAPATSTFFLHSNGKANSSKGNGTLSSSAPTSDEPRDIYLYDPETPIGTPLAFEQSMVEQGNNVLVYTTDPLQQNVQLLGRPRLRIYATSSASETDFVGKLVVLSSTGRAVFVCLGIARSQHLFEGKNYAADTVHLWEFDFEPTSCFFPAGTSIRLEIASSAFPLFDRNPNSRIHPATGDPWTWKRSTQMILHDPAHPSCLLLPALS